MRSTMRARGGKVSRAPEHPRHDTLKGNSKRQLSKNCATFFFRTPRAAGDARQVWQRLPRARTCRELIGQAGRHAVARPTAARSAARRRMGTARPQLWRRCAEACHLRWRRRASGMAAMRVAAAEALEGVARGVGRRRPLRIRPLWTSDASEPPSAEALFVFRRGFSFFV